MDIYTKICGVIHELVGIPTDSISPSSTLDELNLNSLDMEELVLTVEEEFDVLIPEDDKIETVEQLVRLVAAA